MALSEKITNVKVDSDCTFDPTEAISAIIYGQKQILES